MKIHHWLLAGLVLQPAGLVHAEGGCPPGMIPASGTDINSCVPIPPGYYQQQQPMQRQLPPFWEDRWGAIATDGPGGHLGVGTNLSSQSDAEQTALIECRTKGGTDCKIETWYRNGCAAMVGGVSGHNSSNAPTLDEAIEIGMKTCRAADTNCHVFYSDCSLPVRIR